MKGREKTCQDCQRNFTRKISVYIIKAETIVHGIGKWKAMREMSMNMEKIIRLVTKTKELIKNREMAAHVKEKGVADYVTQVDIAVQNFLKKELFLLAPDIQFLGEETGLQEMKADSF